MFVWFLMVTAAVLVILFYVKLENGACCNTTLIIASYYYIPCVSEKTYVVSCRSEWDVGFSMSICLISFRRERRCSPRV